MSEEKDHDVLIRIDTNLKNFMDQFREHEADDKKKFDIMFIAVKDVDRLNQKEKEREKFSIAVSVSVVGLMVKSVWDFFTGK